MSIFQRRNQGVHPNYAKHTSGSELKPLNRIDHVSIPVSMQIGPPPKAIVAKGDHVQVGQVIAEGDAYMSVPVHASVSGEVLEITSEVQSNGRACEVIKIKNDKRFTPYEQLAPPKVESKEDFIKAVRAAGLVGLGGAGFPTHIKLSPPADKPIDYLLVNGMECEPYITSDDWLIRHKAAEILQGIEAVLKWCEIPQAIIGMEENTPEALIAMEEALKNSPYRDKIKVKALSSVYPRGAEKVLIRNFTGREVPSGGLPHDVGCLVQNVGTLRQIAEYLNTGMPLVTRIITMAGPALNRPGIYEVPIGAPIKALIDLGGGLSKVAAKVIMGGPMMGVAVTSLNSPILKMNNAILVFDNESCDLGEELPCIGCGRCVRDCPMHLIPTELDRLSRKFDAENLILYGIDDCMECGACSFICPSKRYLVQHIRIGKQTVRAYRADQAALAAANSKKEDKA
jgi:electron transport complex protein RnfC